MDAKLVADELMCNALYNAPPPKIKKTLKKAKSGAKTKAKIKKDVKERVIKQAKIFCNFGRFGGGCGKRFRVYESR